MGLIQKEMYSERNDQCKYRHQQPTHSLSEDICHLWDVTSQDKIGIQTLNAMLLLQLFVEECH